MTIKIRPEIEQLEAEIIATRRDIHSHPELGFQEIRTAALIAERLAEYGIEVQTEIGKTGVVGTLRGGTDGLMIALRADMDALPMQEHGDVEWKSLNPGKMHACGHDGHTAMLLGAAQYLAETRNFDGRVVLIFQPAEEGRVWHLGAGQFHIGGAAAVVGAYLTWVAGWPVLVLGLVAVLSAVAYTAGPFPLGYHGLGDLFVLVFFGLAAVAGTCFVQTGALGASAWVAGVAIGCLATAILVVNNLRDRGSDARVGKRTLAVRFGSGFARAEYTALLVVAYGCCLAMGWWLPLLCLPCAVVVTRKVFTLDGADLNPVLGETARLELVFGVLLVAELLR